MAVTFTARPGSKGCMGIMATSMFAMLMSMPEIVLILAVLAVMAALGGGTVLLVIWLTRRNKSAIPTGAPYATPTNCPRCGSPLPSDAPQGLCPRCVMAAALETQTETGG